MARGPSRSPAGRRDQEDGRRPPVRLAPRLPRTPGSGLPHAYPAAVTPRRGDPHDTRLAWAAAARARAAHGLHATPPEGGRTRGFELGGPPQATRHAASAETGTKEPARQRTGRQPTKEPI